MKMPVKDRKEHDILIVGAGPSCMGLLYGLLSPYDYNPDINTADSDSAGSNMMNYNIAVIDSGGVTKRDVERDPIKWFSAAETSGNAPYFQESTPQTRLHNRCLPMPIGRGLGGGSNVNACLVTEPAADDFDKWPCRHTSSTSSGDKKDMSIQIPGRMKMGVKLIQRIMKENDAIYTRSDDDLKRRFQGNERLDNRNIFTKIPRASDTTCTSKSIDAENNTIIDQLEVKTATCAVKKINQSSNKDHNQLYERMNYYQALIEPLLERNPHLKDKVTFYCNTQVERLLIEEIKLNERNKTDSPIKIIGVECSKRSNCDEFFSLYSKSKVILSAGAIMSPALLLVSGIGGKDQLKDAGISSALPYDKTASWNAVGKNLQDHILVPKFFQHPLNEYNKPESVCGVRGSVGIDVELNTIKLETKTPGQKSVSRCSISFADGGPVAYLVPYLTKSIIYQHHETNKDMPISRLLGYKFINIIAFAVSRLAHYFLLLVCQWIPIMTVMLQRCTSQLWLFLLNPESIGSVKIKRKKGSTQSINRLQDFHVLVDPGYLNEDGDMDKVISGMEVADKVIATKFPTWKEVCPGPLPLRSYVPYVVAPYFHFCGTCSMISAKNESIEESNDDDNNKNKNNNINNFVVYNDLRVRGLENLYVCDASVFPTIPSGPTALTSAALGWAASPFISKQIKNE